MRKLFLLINVLLCFYEAKSQQAKDTIFYDKIWDISTKYNADYYRIISKEKELFEVKDYFLNGSIQMSGAYKSFNPEIKEGLFTYYDKNGIKTTQESYVDNKKDGPNTRYYESGSIWVYENYSNGLLDGDCFGYFENGQIKRKENYFKGVLKEGKCYTISGVDTTYYPFEIKPEFIGGEKAMRAYVSQNLKYPFKARWKGIEGKVVLSFVVGVDGQINNVELVKSVHPILDKAAIDVITKMPKWTPGFKEGKVVTEKFTLPIFFMFN